MKRGRWKEDARDDESAGVTKAELTAYQALCGDGGSRGGAGEVLRSDGRGWHVDVKGGTQTLYAVAEPYGFELSSSAREICVPLMP